MLTNYKLDNFNALFIANHVISKYFPNKCAWTDLLFQLIKMENNRPIIFNVVKF